MVNIIKLNLEMPNGLCIDGTVRSYERINPSEYKISHLTHDQYKIPGPHYEIEVSTILPQIFPREMMGCLCKRISEDLKNERDRRLSLVSNRNIEVGSDLRYYICCPLLYERHQVAMTKLWLTHQAVFSSFGLSINHFERFMKSKNTYFDDWLEEEEYEEIISDKQRNLIRTNRSLFIQAKAFYRKLQGNHRLITENIADSIIKTIDARVSVKLKKYDTPYMG